MVIASTALPHRTDPKGTLLNARGVPPPLARARRLRGSHGPQVLLNLMVPPQPTASSTNSRGFDNSMTQTMTNDYTREMSDPVYRTDRGVARGAKTMLPGHSVTDYI